MKAVQHAGFTEEKRLAKKQEDLYERATKDRSPRRVGKKHLELIPKPEQDVDE